MRMCQTLVGLLHCLKARIGKPPPVNGETSDSSESDSEAPSVLPEEGKEIKEMTHLFQEWWKSHKEEKKIYIFCSSLCFSFPHCG